MGKGRPAAQGVVTVLRSAKEPSYPASLSHPRRKVTGFLGKLREGERGRGSPARPARLPLPEVGAPAVTGPPPLRPLAPSLRVAHPGAAWCQESDSAHGCSFPAASPCAPHLPGAPQVQTPTSPDDTPKLSRGPPPGLQVSLKALSCSRLPEHSQPCWPPTAEGFPGGDDPREGRGSRRGMGQGLGWGGGRLTLSSFFLEPQNRVQSSSSFASP